MSRRATITALFGVMVALSGCARPAAPAPDGVLTVSVEQTASWVRNFNPLIAGGARWPTAAGIYEPLLVFNTIEGQWVPWLATGFEWLDADLRLRFTIRPGVVWSDGTPFTAADVAFTFDLLKRQPALDQSAAWRYLVEVVAPDASTVDFVLKRAYSPALGMIAHQPIVAAHVWSKVESPVTWSNPEPVGTGPFTEVTVFKNQVYELGRNPRYWQPGKPAIRGLRFLRSRATTRRTSRSSTVRSTGPGTSCRRSIACSSAATPIITNIGFRSWAAPCSSIRTRPSPRSTTCACGARCRRRSIGSAS